MPVLLKQHEKPKKKKSTCLLWEGLFNHWFIPTLALHTKPKQTASANWNTRARSVAISLMRSVSHTRLFSCASSISNGGWKKDRKGISWKSDYWDISPFKWDPVGGEPTRFEAVIDAVVQHYAAVRWCIWMVEFFKEPVSVSAMRDLLLVVSYVLAAEW